MYIRNLRIITFVLVSLFFLQSFAANNWNVPADKKAKNSTFKFDANTAKDGESVYTKNCVSCHGDPTKGNSLKSLNPVPPDLSSVKTQELTDGELFYILNVGRVIMPSFNNVLSEEDRWKVIAYIRSFNKNYVQQLSSNDEAKSKLVNVDMDFNKNTNQLTLKVNANEKTGVVSLKNDEIVLFANRYFGRLQIGESQRTTADGVAVFDFPKDLPGDKDGNVKLVVKVNDDTYGEILRVKTLKIGVPTEIPSLTANRAIWNVLAKAPIWIIVLYISGVLAFGCVLLYLLYSLNKLRKAGNN
jgi:mono/diheme cytochrome c family protein